MDDGRIPAAHKLPPATRAEIINEVRQSLLANDAAVAKAIRILYARQTADEKASGVTIASNKVGVAGCHSFLIVKYGRWLETHPALTGPHLEKARKLALRYAATQLFELAAKKRGLV